MPFAGKSKFGISFRSVSHYFITLIGSANASSSFSLGPYCSCSGRSVRQAGSGAQTQAANLDLLLYKVPVRPAPPHTFEYDGWFQEGPGEKADVAPWCAVYWRGGTIGATRMTRPTLLNRWVKRCADAAIVLKEALMENKNTEKN